MSSNSRTFLRTLCVVGGIALFAQSSQGATVTIDPSDDGSTSNCTDCTPFVSTSNYVLVAGSRDGAVKFPTASIVGQITKATLSLNPYGLPLHGEKLDVYAYSSTIAILVTSEANTGTFIGTWTMPQGLGFGQQTYFDVTAFLSTVSDPYVAFSLRASPTNRTTNNVYSSLEYNYGNPSHLIVATTPVPLPGPLSLLLPALAGLIIVGRRR